MEEQDDDDWVPVFAIGFFPDGEYGGVALLPGAKSFVDEGHLEDAISAAIELLEQIRGVTPGSKVSSGTLH